MLPPAAALPAAVRRTLEHLDYLERTWPDLINLGLTPGGRRHALPSSRRRRSPATLERARADEDAARLERSRPGWIPPLGRTPAPLDVDLLDTLALVASTAEELAETITQTAGVDRPPHVESAYTDPRPWLRTARAWLTAAHAADDRTAPWARDVLAPVTARVASTVGEIIDGQVLDATCPWCKGRTPTKPTGGARTLVVHARTGATGTTPETTHPNHPGGNDGPVIVCHGTTCTPPTSAVGTWIRGQPAWPEREWDWLAGQIHPLQERRHA